MLTPAVRRRDLLAALGISSETLRRRMKDGSMPRPDIDLGGDSQWWRRDTLERAGIRLWPAEEASPQTTEAS